MSEQATDERADIEMLLPWYVTDRLDRDDRARVERYLALHPTMAAQLDLVRAEREQSILGNEALGAPGSGALDRLMASLPAAKPGLAQRLSSSRQWRQLVDLFGAPSARGLRWAAVAAAVLIAVQAGTIATLLVRNGGAYQTASGQAAGEGATALVVFAEDAKASAIAQLLSEFEASIVDGPKPGGVYKVRLRDQPQTTREALLRRLAERRDIVRAILPSRD